MKRLPFFLLILSSSLSVYSAENSTAESNSNAFSKDGLERLTNHFQSYVDDGKLAGLTTLIAHKGKLVHFKTYGQQDKAAGIPTAKDTIYRIYSMTKPITSVAMMMLWEDGKYKLDEPISKYLPSFKNQQVYSSLDDTGNIQTKPLKREATIRDLMRHTAGLTYGTFGNTPVDKLYRSSGLFNPKHDLKSFVEILGKHPLLYQPGEAWVYSFSTDVQGRLIEVLSGMTLDIFFNKRIFKPLEMIDTGFQLTSEQITQLSDIYTQDKEIGLTTYRRGFNRDFTKPPPSLSGGGGLVSSTTDFWRFAQMLANGGVLDDVRLLKEETVAMMSRNQLPDSLQAQSGDKTGFGFGFGFAVVKDAQKNGSFGRVGEYFWNGLANTSFWIDPKEQLVAILMTNIFPSRIYPLRAEIREYVYAALEEQ